MHHKTNQKSFVNSAAIFLLYLTPIGYLLRSAELMQGNYLSGIQVSLPMKEPVSAKILGRPSVKDRIAWLISAGSLLSQAAVIVWNDWGGDWGGGYALIATVYGLVGLISALYPDIQWNKRTIVRGWHLVILAIAFFIGLFVYGQCGAFGVGLTPECWDIWRNTELEAIN